MARKYGPLMHLKLGSVHVVLAASASVASQFLKTHDANFAYRPPNAGANPSEIVGRKGRGQTRGFAHSVCHQRFRENDARVRVFGEGGGDEEFKQMVVELMALSGEFHIGDFIPWLEWLDLQGLVAKLKKIHRRFDDFLNKIIEEHQSGCGTESHRDLLSMLIGLKSDGNGDGEGDSLDDIEIKALLLNSGYQSRRSRRRTDSRVDIVDEDDERESTESTTDR
ncbi:hypothetical protein Scep_016999 [Stephania cephalantha]|uniref:Cytochrome P450 n=1 Tax=Stephania cephalantha TaxID=152367 RepID=A0AAP0IQI6_9MAGN